MRRLLCLVVLLTGCDLYWNGGDDDCKYYGYEGDIAPSIGIRNPSTGECEGGGWGGCEDSCGPCAYDTAGGGALAQPDWAKCQSVCTNLTESSCIQQAGCQASYDLSGATASFAGCFETAPSGPVSTGVCAGFDAHECTRHDNCSTYYNPGSFARCAAETTSSACAAIDCGPGYHCEDQCKDSCGPTGDCGPQCGAMCVPDGNVCAGVDCGPGATCVETCIDPTPTHAGQCYAQCHPTTACETLTTETACTARTDCTTVYNGDDCTCTPSGGCTCEILTYDHCESLHPQPL